MDKRKIVLYGGPCGGKSTSLDDVLNVYLNQSKKAYPMQEMASKLLQLGYLCEYQMDRIDFQKLLFILQFIKEYHQELNNDYIICDRGLLDGRAYISEDEFQSVLKGNGVKKEDILSTYDCALYFRSIAYEYPETFKSKRPYDKLEDALKRDKESKSIWHDVTLPTDYDNYMSFIEKQTMLINMLKNKEFIKDGIILADYYDYDTIKAMYNNMDDLFENNNIPHDVAKRTRSLI